MLPEREPVPDGIRLGPLDSCILAEVAEQRQLEAVDVGLVVGQPDQRALQNLIDRVESAEGKRRTEAVQLLIPRSLVQRIDDPKPALRCQILLRWRRGKSRAISLLSGSEDGRFHTIGRPGIAEIQAERNPPDEVIGQAEDDRRHRPDPAPDQPPHADRPEHLPGQTDGGDEPAALRQPRDLQVQDAL